MKSFTEEFNIDVESKNYREVDDYETFANKELLDELRNKIIQNLIDKQVNITGSFDTFIKKEIDKTLEGYDLSGVEISHIYNLIDNEINGCGPITELLDDPNISEIMVNGTNKIFIEVEGKITQDESVSFINDEHIIRTIQRMIQPLGRTIDIQNPMVDARLEDGSRLNAVIPPLSVNGPVLTIRKFKEELKDIEDFLRNGALTYEMARFLELCVKSKLNIIICGGTGAGKTTLLNALSSFINNDERIITIEDAAELKLNQPHVISLETRLNNYEQDTEVSIRDLVINSLRMRPDRIVVGECRGKEAFDMLQAMNTGHTGSLTTMHANSPIDALNRLETLVLMAGIEIPIKAVREYIDKAIDLIIHIERLGDGRRRIVKIEEVIGIKDEDIQLNELFKFNQLGIADNSEITGEFSKSSKLPKFASKLNLNSTETLNEIFKPKKKVEKND